jgi:hypothetical protein
LNGQYSIAAKQGPAIGVNRVEIHWSRKTGRKTRYDPNMDEYKEAIPTRFNSDSKLTVDLQPGNNRKDLHLKSR